MSVRASFPKAQLPQTHYFITFARGEQLRCFALRPVALFSILALFPLFALIYLGATMTLLLRDDMISALMSRQGSLQAAYEERIADMRSQIDLVTSRQLLDQNSLEARIHEMLSRQAQLENRAAVIATLAQGVAGIGEPAKPAQTQGQIPLPVPLPQEAGAAGRRAEAPQTDPMPVGVTGYAPRQTQSAAGLQAIGGTFAAAASGMTGIARQETLQPPAQPELRASVDRFGAPLAGDTSLPATTRVGALMRSLDRLEIEQIASVNRIGATARAREAQLRRIISATGLSADNLKASTGSSDVGGPFVPFKLDPNGSLFEREVLRFQDSVVSADRLMRIVRALPVGRPLPASAAITSSFGTRVDPFNGRLASHTGIDFREAHGAPVYASGSGRVVTASYSGGYGNMVEIDHGNGVTSRYAHLSAITVRDGQQIGAGVMIGRIGSTGRSTGPHLHYEVRHNDHPLDPRRFLALREKIAIH